MAASADGTAVHLIDGTTVRTVQAVQGVDGLDAVNPADLARQARRLSMWARVVLVPVAVIGAVLSYQSLYKAAQPTFGPYLAGGFPLLVDLLILGASLQYVAGAKVGRPMTGWRLTAHCGVAGTLILNALAAREVGDVPWHVTAPAVWAVLVELTGKQVLGQWRATQHTPAASIAPSLWLSSPIESFRTRLLMARTGVGDASEARIGVGTAAAAREALNLSLPRRSGPRRDARRVRRVVNRQLRAGSLPPAAVMEAVGWTGPDQRTGRSPESILRAVVQTILRPAEEKPVVKPVVTDQAAAQPLSAFGAAELLEPVTVRSPDPADSGREPMTPSPVGPVTAGPGAPERVVPAQLPQPAPLQPAPLQPAPLQPAPLQPAPLQPAPLQPAGMQPAGMPSPTVPLPAGEREPEPLSMWAAAQARTNGPTTSPVPADVPGSQRPEPQAWAGTPSDPAPEVYGAWSPVPPYKPVGPVPPRLEFDDDPLDTGSMPTLSGRPTAKQKEERLAIAVRIVHRRPEITGAELRAELEREGWLVSDRTAARILGEARVAPPLRAVQG